MLGRAASLGGGGWRGEDGAVGACTESLGSETGDVGGDTEIDHQLGQRAAAEEEEEEEAGVEPQVYQAAPEKKPRRLPPPMPRAAEGAFSMRAERRGGRLILTEVRVDQRRREVFRAERAGGRLRLQFAATDPRRQASHSPDQGEPGAAAGGAEVVGGCCNSGAGEFCHVAVEARRSRVEIGAVMGT